MNGVSLSWLLGKPLQLAVTTDERTERTADETNGEPSSVVVRSETSTLGPLALTVLAAEPEDVGADDAAVSGALIEDGAVGD